MRACKSKPEQCLNKSYAFVQALFRLRFAKGTIGYDLQALLFRLQFVKAGFARIGLPLSKSRGFNHCHFENKKYLF